MSEKNEDMYKALVKPENDEEYKMFILKRTESTMDRVDSVHDAQIATDNKHKYFKVQMLALIVVLTGVRESILKYLNIH